MRPAWLDRVRAPLGGCLALLVSAGLAGCARGGVRGDAGAGADRQEVATPPEPSVQPGANDNYLDPALDVAEWQRRFESDGRDIFDRRQDIVKLTGLRPGMAVADVGAGTGLFTLLFADAVGSTGKVYAIDIARPFVELITRRARERGLTQVVPVLSGERSIELPEGSIDVAFLCDVYHHLEYPQSVLASIRRALRPGGTLLLIDMHREPGRSRPWVLEHVRAGEAVFVQEIEAAGFRRLSRHDLLRDNYVVRFARP